jgi:hypothetical protein
MCLNSIQIDDNAKPVSTAKISPSSSSSSSNSSMNTAPNDNTTKSNTGNSSLPLPIWLLVTYISKEFAVFLATHQSEAASKTFVPAYYSYDEDETSFDNTFLTWGTDYMLALLFTYVTYKCYKMSSSSSDDGSSSSNSNSAFMTTPTKPSSLGYKAAALFGSYAMSVLCGGYAHYTYTTLDSLNTLSFRIWWTICVGSVTAAGGFMGMCGSEIYHQLKKHDMIQDDTSGSGAGTGGILGRSRFNLFQVSTFQWWIYAIVMTGFCIVGDISYKRPACDIFVAGTGQFFPTVYCELVLLSFRWRDAATPVEGKWSASSSSSSSSSRHAVIYNRIGRTFRIMYYAGFALNAPLLPSYPLLVQYTNLSLGVVNAIMHMNLTVAWGMQALTVYHVCKAIAAADAVGNDNSNYQEVADATEKKSL